MIALRFVVLAAFALTIQSVYGGEDPKTAFVEAIFGAGDSNTDHQLTAAELNALAPGQSALIEKYDDNKDGNINLAEFKDLMKDEAFLLPLFDALDKDDNGQVTKAEIEEYFKNFNSQIPEAVINNAIAAVDGDNNKQLSFAEFKTLFV